MDSNSESEAYLQIRVQNYELDDRSSISKHTTYFVTQSLRPVRAFRGLMYKLWNGYPVLSFAIKKKRKEKLQRQASTSLSNFLLSCCTTLYQKRGLDTWLMWLRQIYHNLHDFVGHVGLYQNHNSYYITL